MNLKLVLLCVFSFTTLTAQNQHEGIILDSETKEPIEFVNIYNSIDYTLSNEDGRYNLNSEQDSVIFYRVGYDNFETTFYQLKDTIFLNKSVFELNEVVVTNAKSLWEKVRDSIKNNYRITPYKEKFFLRSILKYNDTISRIQDLHAKLKRKTLLYHKDLKLDKKDFEVEILNMRKVGQITDRNKVYFKYPSLFDLLSSFVRLNASGDNFVLTEKTFENSEKIKLEFKGKPNTTASPISGFYIINTSNNAFEEFHVHHKYDNPKFNEKRWLRYRTLEYELSVIFEKNLIENKYFIRTAKSHEIVEATDADHSFNEKYDMSFIFSSYDNFKDFPVSKNTNVTKDLFKLKHAYDANYWQSQNQLLLTKEMEDFIQTMTLENEVFKVNSNMN